MDKVVSVATIMDGYSQSLVDFLHRASQLLTSNFQYYEIVLISRKSSIRDTVSLKQAIQKIPKIRVIELANDCDEDIAYNAALNSAIGDAVVLMDFNQDSLELIPQMVNNIVNEEADVIIAHNISLKKGRSLSYWLSRFFYQYASLLCDQSIDFDATHFSCYSRSAINCVLQHKNNTRNLRLLRQLLGLKTVVLNYVGTSFSPKNTRALLRRIFSRTEAVFHLSVKPLRIVSAITLLLSVSNIFYITYIVGVRIFFNHVAPGWASISLMQSAVFLVLFFSISIIAFYLNIISQEIQKRPLYTITNEWFSDNGIMDFVKKNVVEN